MTPETLQHLISIAEQAMKHAHAPYSQFPVGAAILSKTQKMYPGANVENACYAMGQCAEASAIGTMITQGDQEIEAVALISLANEPIFPCGGCLQKIAEFATPDTLIISRTSTGLERKWRFAELFPLHFDQRFLTKHPA